MALTVKQVEQAIIQKDGNISEAAAELGVARSTIYRKINQHDSLKELLVDARETLVDLAESKLKSEIRKGNITAIIFTLKTLGKARGYIERQEFTHSGRLEVSVDWDAESPD